MAGRGVQAAEAAPDNIVVIFSLARKWKRTQTDPNYTCVSLERDSNCRDSHP